MLGYTVYAINHGHTENRKSWWCQFCRHRWHGRMWWRWLPMSPATTNLAPWERSTYIHIFLLRCFCCFVAILFSAINGFHVDIYPYISRLLRYQSDVSVPETGKFLLSTTKHKKCETCAYLLTRHTWCIMSIKYKHEMYNPLCSNIA